MFSTALKIIEDNMFYVILLIHSVIYIVYPKTLYSQLKAIVNYSVEIKDAECQSLKE